VTQRLLSSQGITNLRDVGGYLGRHGRKVAWGRLLRSGHLANATEADLDGLGTLGVVEIHDFRRPSEQAMHPSPELPSIRTHHYKLRMGSTEGFIDRFIAGEMSADDTHQMMVDGYRSFINQRGDEFGRLLRQLARPSDGSALMHCTAGKDRTGVGIALVLLALEVDPEVILADYLLTIEAQPAENVLAIMDQFLRQRGIGEWDREAMRPYCTVHADYLSAAFDEIARGWGDAPTYFEMAMGLDAAAIEQLQTRFLEG
jgi:protein-tyrosine phosphatase